VGEGVHDIVKRFGEIEIARFLCSIEYRKRNSIQVDSFFFVEAGNVECRGLAQQFDDILNSTFSISSPLLPPFLYSSLSPSAPAISLYALVPFFLLFPTFPYFSLLFPPAPSCSLLLPPAPSCSLLLPPAPSCSLLLPPAPFSITLLYNPPL